jgi:pyridoxamine 5'-phosphate oxidase
MDCWQVHKPTLMRKVSSEILQRLREEYLAETLDLESAAADPIKQFDHWMDEALKAAVPEPNAMTLATVNTDGWPEGRVVLLKGFDEQGFTFFTNYESAKGAELLHNPKASLVFCWLELQRQVRIRGMVDKIPRAESVAYFRSRPRGSQLGAWASPQSTPVANRSVLEQRLKAVEEKFAGVEQIPCPEHWGGYILRPEQIEFWQGRASRMHDRIRYRKSDQNWDLERLAP